MIAMNMAVKSAVCVVGSASEDAVGVHELVMIVIRDLKSLIGNASRPRRSKRVCGKYNRKHDNQTRLHRVDYGRVFDSQTEVPEKVVQAVHVRQTSRHYR